MSCLYKHTPRLANTSSEYSDFTTVVQEIVQENICCLDSCVDTTGKLTAYRWSGEKHLSPDNLVVVG